MDGLCSKWEQQEEADTMELIFLIYSTALSVSDAIERSSGRMIGKQRVGKHLEGSGRDLIEVLMGRP
jgi:hypothetical protein